MVLALIHMTLGVYARAGIYSLISDVPGMQGCMIDAQ